jgi:hypothetical protein
VNRAGTGRRLQTQNQLETDINALSMDQGGCKRDAVGSVGAAEGTADELLDQLNSIPAQSRPIGPEGGFHACK